MADKMAQNITLQFVEEKDLENLENVKLLFTEYSNSLNIDLCFQDFNNELKHFQENIKTFRLIDIGIC